MSEKSIRKIEKRIHDSLLRGNMGKNNVVGYTASVTDQNNDTDESVVTVQPIVYKEMPRVLSRSKSAVTEANNPRLNQNGVILKDSVQGNGFVSYPMYGMLGKQNFPAYYVYNDLNHAGVQSLFSKPTFDVVNVKSQELNLKPEKTPENPKSEDTLSLNKKQEPAIENKQSPTPPSASSKQKSVAESMPAKTPEREPLYTRKKYYLLHTESKDPDDDKLPTKCTAAYWFLRQFYGCPCYMWTLVFIFILAIIGVFTWLLTMYLYTESLNKSYFATCSSNLDCNVDSLLHCAVLNSACACPASISTGRCDCSPGYFWNGTRCSILMNHNDNYCAADFNCDPTKFLQCVNQTCSCQYPKVWNTTTQMCDYAYVGCYTDTAPQATFQSQTARIIYFVEICVDTCMKMKSKYAMASYNGNVNNCYCNSTVNTTVSTSCEIFCPGGNTDGRRCGSSSITFNDKAVYKVF